MIRSHFGLELNPFDDHKPALLAHQKEIFDTVKVHAQQGGAFFVGSFSEHGLVAYGNPMLIGPHLCTPHPKGLEAKPQKFAPPGESRRRCI